MSDTLDGIATSVAVGFIVVIATLLLAGVTYVIQEGGGWLIAIGIGFFMMLVGFAAYYAREHIDG